MTVLSEPELERLLSPLLAKMRICSDLSEYNALLASLDGFEEFADLQQLFKHPAMARNARAPERGTVLGDYANEVMRLVNKFCVQDAAKRFVVGSGGSEVQTIVEIGPGGHGYSLDVFQDAFTTGKLPNFRNLGLVEISDAFREQCTQHAKRLFGEENVVEEGWSSTTDEEEVAARREHGRVKVRLTGEDCRELSWIVATGPGGLDSRVDQHRPEDGTVDRLFAVNVIYFLHPLQEYLREFLRVLKPNSGRGVFVLKKVAEQVDEGATEEKDSNKFFHHTDPSRLVDEFKQAGFSVSVETGGTGDPIDEYTALVVWR